MNRVERSLALSRLKGIADFIRIASQYQCRIQVRGTNSIVDGKSIMGILSLALQQPLTVVAEGDDAPDFATRLDQIQLR